MLPRLKNSRRWLLAALMVVCLSRMTEASTSHNSNEHVVKSESLIEESGTLLKFQHRHFFNYDMSSSNSASYRFQVKDTDDALSSYEASAFRPREFTLRAHEFPTFPTNHSGSLDQRIMDTKSPARVAPNVTDKETIVNLAKMTSDAYIYDPREPSWLNTSLGFNFTARFGWMGEGLRGHVFTTEDNMTVVISFKGTTIDPRDPLSGKDRINDNKLFGCCCGAQNPWHRAPVCDCRTGHNQCNSECLTRELLSNDSYYDSALFVERYYRSRYPGATFWLVGHSLGGTLASLVGLTSNIPAVTYESPPERLATQRMGLIAPHAERRAIAHHFGNTADPIHMGECNGLLSSCAIGGFTFDTKCFSGRRCLYDTIKDKRWYSSVIHHRIVDVIEHVLQDYDEVPACTTDDECADCTEWEFS